MLERARGRIDAHGVRNVELRRMDAVSMDFESLLERLISPLTVRIGFRSDLDLPGFLEHAGLDPISVDKVGIPKILSLVVFRNGD